MTRKQYTVHTVRDEPGRLRDQLDHIAAEGGRVVSVIWQPTLTDRIAMVSVYPEGARGLPGTAWWWTQSPRTSLRRPDIR